MKIRTIKAISGLAAVLIAANTVFTPLHTSSPVRAEMTVAELEEQKAENDKKIEELKKEIEEARKQYDSVVSDENAKLEYQDALNQKIVLQNENIGVVVEQMNQIDADIKETLTNISDIEVKIKQQNRMIDRNMDLYKERLRASYMSDADTISSVLAGSTSFIDILSKFEIISKVAEHDNRLISDLEKQLAELKKMNEELGNKQQELSENLEDATERKSELDEKLSVLQADFAETQEELNKLNDKKAVIADDIETNSEIIAAKEAEMEMIDAQIEEVMERMRLESIAESKRVSESVSQSIEESRRAEAEKPVTQAPVQVQKPVTQAPDDDYDEDEEDYDEDDTPSAPSDDTGSSGSAPVVEDSSLMMWPVPGYTHHSSDFWDGRNHGAVDIDGGIFGAEIFAADSGVVAAAVSTCTHQSGGCRCGGGYGNYVAIAHNDGITSTYYAHCSAVYVTAGQTVTKGQLIGLVGTTGYSTGPHLHFEVRKNNIKTDPDSYSYQNYY